MGVQDDQICAHGWVGQANLLLFLFSLASAVQLFRKRDWTSKTEKLPLRFLLNLRAIFFFQMKGQIFRVLERKFSKKICGRKRARNPKGGRAQNSQSGFSSKKVRISFNKHNIMRKSCFWSFEASPPEADRLKFARVFQAFLNSKCRVRSEI